MTMSTVSSLFITVALLVSQESGSNIASNAKVLNGGTLEIDGRKIELSGVDAPQINQHCTDKGGKNYNCGLLSSNRLSEWIVNKRVVCHAGGSVNYSPSRQICTADGKDISKYAIRSGWVVASSAPDGRPYLKDERLAQNHRIGLWAGKFVRPIDWRHSMTTQKPISAK